MSCPKRPKICIRKEQLSNPNVEELKIDSKKITPVNFFSCFLALLSNQTEGKKMYNWAVEKTVTNLTFVDNEVYSLEYLLLGFWNHSRQIFDFKQKLLITAVNARSFSGMNGGKSGGERQRATRGGADREKTSCRACKCAEIGGGFWDESERRRLWRTGAAESSHCLLKHYPSRRAKQTFMSEEKKLWASSFWGLSHGASPNDIRKHYES